MGVERLIGGSSGSDAPRGAPDGPDGPKAAAGGAATSATYDADRDMACATPRPTDPMAHATATTTVTLHIARNDARAERRALSEH